MDTFVLNFSFFFVLTLSNLEHWTVVQRQKDTIHYLEVEKFINFMYGMYFKNRILELILKVTEVASPHNDGR